jgi:ferredoxin
MTYTIAEPCIGTKDTACVEVCPVDCIHPKKDEAEFEAATRLYIDPETCIDCGACVGVPGQAIFPRKRCRRSGSTSRPRSCVVRGARAPSTTASASAPQRRNRCCRVMRTERPCHRRWPAGTSTRHRLQHRAVEHRPAFDDGDVHHVPLLSIQMSTTGEPSILSRAADG